MPYTLLSLFWGQQGLHTAKESEAVYFGWWKPGKIGNNFATLCGIVPGGGGVLPKNWVGGVRPASKNPCPIYDQNLRFYLPHL